MQRREEPGGPKVWLPSPGEGRRRHQLSVSALPPSSVEPPKSRRAFAACHVVADVWTSSRGGDTQIDWEQTLAERHYVWSQGLGVAEAMDTAQRGQGLGPSHARELTARTLAAARERFGSSAERLLVGVGTDHLTGTTHSVRDIVGAYQDQAAFVEDRGGRTVLLASRHLAAIAGEPKDYYRVYDSILRQLTGPTVIHWLGVPFDPALRGYWGDPDPYRARRHLLELIHEHAEKIQGIKLSVLDAELERSVRAELPPGVRLFTGDDYNYVDLICGADGLHSDALLGAFSLFPAVAAAALRRLDVGDIGGYRALLEPTLALSRLVFEAPTSFYKVGVVWLAYLSGRQAHFRMLDGLESARTAMHLVRVFEHADALGLFPDPELTAHRLRSYLAVHGLD